MKWLLVLLFMFVSVHALAASEYSVDVPELLGEHSHIDRGSVVEIDFERSFEAIEAVWLELDGYAVGGWGEPTRDGEGTGEQEPMDIRPSFSLADVFEPASFRLGTPTARPDPLRNSFRVETPFRGSSLRRSHRVATARLGDEGVAEVRAVPREPETDWSFLLDGRAVLRITWRSDGCGDRGGCRYLEHPTADISRATLVIRGTRR